MAILKINSEQLKLIPKIQEYIEYMLDIILKLPRIEKFNIGNEYKSSMYKMLEYTLYICKIQVRERLNYINKVDAELDCQRIYLRMMYKYKWVDEKKFRIAISKISEMGKIVGGLVKYYAKNN